jgi:hypothetical protein
MSQNSQNTFKGNPVKGLELLQEFARYKPSPYRSDALRNVGDPESAQMIEALAERLEAYKQYVTLYEIGLLSYEKFTEKIRALVGAVG